MGDPALYASNPARYAALAQRLEAARAQKDQDETAWLELEEMRAAFNP